MDEINRLEINVFRILCDKKDEVKGTIAHELVHWSQASFDPKNYGESIENLQKSLGVNFNAQIYQNNPYERQAHMNNIIQELSSTEYSPDLNFDEFLNQSPTWLRIKPRLYKENVIQIKKALYNYFNS